MNQIDEKQRAARECELVRVRACNALYDHERPYFDAINRGAHFVRTSEWDQKRIELSRAVMLADDALHAAVWKGAPYP